MNHPEQIPSWGYINFQLLYQIHLVQEGQLSRNTTIADLVNDTSKRIGSNVSLSEFYSPINAGTVFSFLYSVIVVPKELFKEENKTFFDDFRIDSTSVFENVEIGKELLPTTHQILRFLRNSISHVNYQIDKDDRTVEMWNVNKSHKIDIRVRTDINSLANLGVKIARYYASKQSR